jgi:hypothetical protein
MSRTDYAYQIDTFKTEKDAIWIQPKDFHLEETVKKSIFDPIDLIKLLPFDCITIIA